MKPREFMRSLRSLTFEDVFNPYADRCAVHDLCDAPAKRSNILLAMIERATDAPIDSMWIGRDLGHRGGRRTGLALTDDVHLAAHATRWNVTVERATKGSPVAERTAAVIWNMLVLVPVRVFLWNVFPLHPHAPDEPFTNRSHKPVERRAGEELLRELISLLRPKRLVAIGNDAGSAARKMNAANVNVVQVRHPSYGGQKDFMAQIGAIYDLHPSHNQQSLFDYDRTC